MTVTALIMAGGSGKRFWPLSTEDRPKQLLNLYSEKTMIRETVDRILPIIPAECIYIATNIKQSEAIKNELPFIPRENIIIEPSFKDTAAAIGLSSLYIKKRHQNPQMIVLASDHLIQNKVRFREILLKAYKVSRKNKTIVSLGIKPNKPEIGYGYIEIDKNSEIGKASKVKAFCEKPDLAKAIKYVNSGNYLWNSGMYIFSVDTILKEIEKYLPKHAKLLNLIDKILEYGLTGEILTNKIAAYYERFDKISIDYGVMEHTDRIQVIPSDFGWNDIGSFTALSDVFEANQNGTVVRDAIIKELNCKNNIIIGNGLEIATIGIEDMVIIQTEDKLLICRKDQVQEIKKILA